MSTTTNVKNWQQDGKYVELNGAQHFVISKGQGETLLLLHGFPSSSWDWHKVIKPLSKCFHVIAVDMLGYGLSDKPTDGNYQTRAQVNRLVTLLSEWKIEACHLMAFSYGSSVAQEFLFQQQKKQHQIQVKSLCLLNGGLFPDSNRPKLAQKLLMSPIGKWINLFFTETTLAKNLKAIFGPNTQPNEETLTTFWQFLTYNQGKRVLPKLIQ